MLMNLIKVMNFSGAGEPINFSFTKRGLKRPEPAAVHVAFLGHGDAFGTARRVDRLLADALCGGFLARFRGKPIQERERWRVSSRTGGDYAGVTCLTAARMIAAT
jgi:hypothetical protein